MSGLVARDLTVRFGGRRALDRAGFRLAAGELVAIVGPNGAGKSTLLRALCGLVAADGEVTLDGAALAGLAPRERARRLAYLPQGHAFHWPMPVAEIVALGRLPHGGGGSEADKAAVTRALAATGVAEFADRPVTTLSGGERARVALARVLAVEARLILADEPVAALDPRYRILVMEMLRRAVAEGTGVAVVLHDLAMAARFADRIVVIHEGQVVAEGQARALFSDDLLRTVFGIEALRFAHEGGEVLLPWSAL